MREIKFRAKVETGEWAIGSLIYDMSYDDLSTKNNSQYYIQERFSNAISLAVTDENTIGQYTGLKDKNGKEIYEGDIVEFDGDKRRSAVIWDYGKYNQVTGFRLEQYPLYSVCEHNCDLFEVIGNIHDNPELLEANDGNK